MAKVVVRCFAGTGAVLAMKEITTTGDHAYVFEDIANALLDEAGELRRDLPKGTKELRITIPCDL